MSEKILIVEDEIDVAELLAHNLRGEGFVVEIVNNGRAALATIKNQPPALIVLDLMLPELSGLDLCRMIKSNPGTKNVPIVMLPPESRKSIACLDSSSVLMIMSSNRSALGNW